MMCGNPKSLAITLFLLLNFYVFATAAQHNFDAVKNTFELLKRGKPKIKLSKSKEIVLVLGNTGSGKKNQFC
jgi:hypothetical protein